MLLITRRHLIKCSPLGHQVAGIWTPLLLVQAISLQVNLSH